MVTRDHYAVLGVSPTSEDVVIQAAYRALMRRYHPDADPSSEAAQRAQAINAAYAVLGDPEKRARYDGSLAAQGLIKPEIVHSRGFLRRLLPGPAGMVGLTALVAAGAVLVFSPPIGIVRESPQPSSSEILPTRVATENAELVPIGKAVEDLCTNSAVPGLIKAELVRRAAAVGGADRELVERIGSYAVLRLESPASRTVETSGAAGCSAGASLDLPPGLVVDGGRTNLNAQLSYGVSKSGSGMRLAGLSGAGSLLRSLATLGPAPSEAIDINLIPPYQAAAARPAETPPVEKARRTEASSTKPAAVASAVPNQQSSSCRLGNGWADRAVCGSSNLTALDRQHGLLYAQSWARADEGKRAALLGSRDRFREKRDACRSETCLTSAYLARLREISDIMARRLQQ